MKKSSVHFSRAESLIIRAAFVALLFLGVPVFIALIARGYDGKASGILDQSSALADIHGSSGPGQMKVLTQKEADTLQHISRIIVAEWESAQDGKYVLKMKDNNAFEEYYEGKKEGFGTWRIFSAQSSGEALSALSNATSTASDASLGASSYYLLKTQSEAGHKGEKYVYEIQSLDEGSLVLFYLNTARPLMFTRASSSASW